jgi:hypothetical protein
VEHAHGVDAAAEGFVSDALVFVPFADGKPVDEFGTDFSAASCLPQQQDYVEGEMD